MTIKVTEEQYNVIKEISDVEEWLNILLSQSVGYYKTKELVKAYRTKNLKVVSDGDSTHI